MKKILIIPALISGIAYGAENSWLTSMGKAASNLVLYPVKVIMNKGPLFLRDEASGLCELIDTEEKAAIAVTASTVALTAGALFLGPVSFVLAPAAVIALDLSYPENE